MGQVRYKQVMSLAVVLGVAILASSAGSAFAWSGKGYCRYERHNKYQGFHATAVFADSPYCSGWSSSSPYLPKQRWHARKRYPYTYEKVVVVNSPVTVANTETVVINVPNPNGSYTPVTLRRSGGTTIGPRGEHYDQEPTIEQLQALYGLK
jgi:hypothetical protein